MIGSSDSLRDATHLASVDQRGRWQNPFVQYPAQANLNPHAQAFRCRVSRPSADCFCSSKSRHLHLLSPQDVLLHLYVLLQLNAGGGEVLLWLYATFYYSCMSATMKILLQMYAKLYYSYTPVWLHDMCVRVCALVGLLDVCWPKQ